MKIISVHEQVSSQDRTKEIRDFVNTKLNEAECAPDPQVVDEFVRLVREKIRLFGEYKKDLTIVDAVHRVINEILLSTEQESAYEEYIEFMNSDKNKNSHTRHKPHTFQQFILPHSRLSSEFENWLTIRERGLWPGERVVHTDFGNRRFSRVIYITVNCGLFLYDDFRNGGCHQPSNFVLAPKNKKKRAKAKH